MTGLDLPRDYLLSSAVWTSGLHLLELAGNFCSHILVQPFCASQFTTLLFHAGQHGSVKETELVVVRMSNETWLNDDAAARGYTVLRTHHGIPPSTSITSLWNEANALLRPLWGLGWAKLGVIGHGLLVLIAVVPVVLDWDGVQGKGVFSEAIHHGARDTAVVPRKAC